MTANMTTPPAASAQLEPLEELQWLADRGGRFCLPAGRTKGRDASGKATLPKGWEHTPNVFADARAHAQRGGNVGLLTGQNSGGIIALDLDRDFAAMVDLLGSVAQTARIVRDNAPDRGKLLYHVSGPVEARMWKPAGETGSPWAELLGERRHAVCPPSIFDGGHYRLVDREYGIVELDEDALASIWWRVTDGRPGLASLPSSSPAAAAKAAPPHQQDAGGGDAERIRAAWSPLEVFQHHGWATEQRGEGGEIRLSGHGGLLVKDAAWYCFADGVGGDCIAAWAYVTRKRANVTGREFGAVLREMAAAKGIDLAPHGKRAPAPAPSSGPAPSPAQGDAGSSGAQDAAPGEDAPRHLTWPYGVEGGRLVRYKRDRGADGDSIDVALPLADFTAAIVGQYIDEAGERRFVIEGRGLRGGPFTAEIGAGDYADTGKLIGLLDGQSATDAVYADQRAHIGPAIKKLSADVWTQRRYTRVGWAGSKFLIPGREPDNVRLDLPEKLPFAIPAAAELEQGLAALEALLRAPGAERGSVIAAYILGAPLARVAGWGNERHGLAAVGPTGTYKTSTMQAFMSIYGPGFLDDHSLIGPANLTRNAALSLAASAHDMPILLDNYKPNINGGPADLVALVHSIVEGGDKLRLNRASELKQAKPIHTWPLITGEDLPNTDAAALARMLVIRFERSDNTGNADLTHAQKSARHLAAVGGAWLDWLESADGQREAQLAGAAFEARRAVWAQRMQSIAPDMANPLRVASNLATNAIAFDVAQRHPTIGPILRRYAQAHGAGLETVAREMGRYTTHSSEAARFLAGLAEMLAGGRAILKTADPQLAETFPGAIVAPDAADWARRGVGWVDGNGVYLMPRTILTVFKREMGDDLGSVTENALYAQLRAMGAIRPGKDGNLVVKRMGGDPVRVLHLALGALRAAGDGD